MVRWLVGKTNRDQGEIDMLWFGHSNRIKELEAME